MHYLEFFLLQVLPQVYSKNKIRTSGRCNPNRRYCIVQFKRLVVVVVFRRGNVYFVHPHKIIRFIAVE